MSKFKVGDKVRVKTDLIKGKRYGNLTFWSGLMSKHKGLVSTVKRVTEHGEYFLSNGFYWNDEMLEPADSKIVRMADGTIIGDFSTGGFCDGFRGGKIPTPEKPIPIEEQLGLPKGVFIHDLDYADLLRREYTMSFATKNMIKEDKPMKFTFYTEEGYRIDKSNNSKVETITTFVKINGFDNTYLGMATCDKVNYSEREGVINALANAMCNGNFDREFNKAVKDNARANKKARTCTYCGQLFDTIAEKKAHEAWHVERKKARRERYLLRKRAKEIAFEEAAQKLAKEIIAEDNKK